MTGKQDTATSSLFAMAAQRDAKSQPLAYRMRPRTLDEYIGQDHIVGKGRLLRRAIQADQLSSVIFYGPPGTGKTTLARVIANTTKRHFSTLNAVLTGVKELREEIQLARQRMENYGQGTILFVDEVHRWNKSQQDALLPWVENGTVIFIGATTENPFFEVNAALVSRSRIFQLKALTGDDLLKIAQQALHDPERGYGKYHISFEEGALEHLVEVAGGDARSLLNALQLAVETSVEPFPPVDPQREILITKQAAEESIQRKVVLYDKEGDYHFDVISAFIKSLRGSDPDAALYWLAKMVAAGEDPRFIFRRMLISACEDVGLADPQAIVVVQADADAFDRIGLPEGQFHLTHAALYLATAPKSNSTLAFFDALKTVEEENAQTEVPNHLRDASRDSNGFGHGDGYLYPHSYKDHWVAQQYLPSTLQGKVFYQPGDLGYERQIRDQVLERREEQIENAAIDAYQENLSYSPGDKQREMWVNRTISERGTMLRKLKETLYGQLDLRRSDRVLVLNAGFGMLLWPAYRLVPEGLVMAQVENQDQASYLGRYAQTLPELSRPDIRCQNIEQLLGSLDRDLLFEAVVGRNILNKLRDAKERVSLLAGHLAKGGVISLAQAIPSESSRLSDFVTDGEAKARMQDCERALYHVAGPALSSWTGKDLEQLLKESGLYVQTTYQDITEMRMVSPENLAHWLASSYQGCEHLAGKLACLTSEPLCWHTKTAIIKASNIPLEEGRKNPKHDENWLRIESSSAKSC